MSPSGMDLRKGAGECDRLRLAESAGRVGRPNSENSNGHAGCPCSSSWYGANGPSRPEASEDAEGTWLIAYMQNLRSSGWRIS